MLTKNLPLILYDLRYKLLKTENMIGSNYVFEKTKEISSKTLKYALLSLFCRSISCNL